MEYTIIVNEQSYDLPKKTITVMNKLDEVLKVDSTKGLNVTQKYAKLHNFMKELVGEENTTEMFGSGKLDEIDLSELTLAVRKVIDAYDKPVADYEAEKSRAKLNNLPIEQLNAITKAAEKMANMPRNK